MRLLVRNALVLVGACLLLAACGSDPAEGGPADAGIDLGAPIGDAGGEGDEGGWSMEDGGYPIGDGGTLRKDRFITTVVSFEPGACGGFNASALPGVVQGPPIGGGETQGSLDVVSLGNGGEIVVSFEPNAIVDGPGVDFIVFENAFFAGGNPNNVYAELGEVSVSEDGESWSTFPCTATSAPYGACAGWRPVFSNPTDAISPIDPERAGGDPFDLADVGLTTARYVRIRDKTNAPCTPPNNNNGFDLDAIAIVNPLLP